MLRTMKGTLVLAVIAAMQFGSQSEVAACASCRAKGERGKACELKNREDAPEVVWSDPSAALFLTAIEKKQALVFYFGDAEDTAPDQTDFAAQATEGLVHGILVSKPKEQADQQVSTPQDTSPQKSEAPIAAPVAVAHSVIPASRTSASDLWKEYGVSTKGVFVLTDWFGNEVARSESPQLRDQLLAAGKTIRAARDAVATATEKARAALATGNTRDAIVALHQGFEAKLVGYEECKAAESLYRELMDKGQQELKAAQSDKAKIGQLLTTYKDSDIASEIEAALATVTTKSAS